MSTKSTISQILLNTYFKRFYMNTIIDRGIIEKNGLTFDEFVVLMLVMHNINLTQAKDSIVKKGLALATFDILEDGLALEKTQLGVTTYNNIVLASSSQAEISEERLNNLAKELKAVYPKGKKDGTWYWADGVAVIARRLKIFFHKYDPKRQFTDEQIINATKRYVEEKQAQSDMRLLKYFIFKEAVGKAGDVEPTSDLLTYIENEGEVSTDADANFVNLV